MDCEKTGAYIYTLRKEQNLTQQQLAQQLHISDKTVSKWERGLGCPEISLLERLSDIFHVPLENLLSGDRKQKDAIGGNLGKTKFYVCPNCGNFLIAAEQTDIVCCGKKLLPLVPQEKIDTEALCIERLEDEYFITTKHPMEKEHYISFVAFLANDKIVFCKQYPQWDIQLRIPYFAQGTLFWYCSQHGLFQKIIKREKKQ